MGRSSDMSTSSESRPQRWELYARRKPPSVLGAKFAQASSLKGFRLNTDSESKREPWIASGNMEAVGKLPLSLSLTIDGDWAGRR